MSNRIIKKNSNDFSFVDEVLNEVNNTEFKNGILDFQNAKENGLSCNTSKSYIWTTLSAVGNDIAEEIYQNILNYIDNVSDIDTCTIKALQSMIEMLGTNYSALANIEYVPIELLDVMNVFSIRSDYLLKSNKIANSTIDYFKTREHFLMTSADISIPLISAMSSINEYRQKSKYEDYLTVRDSISADALDDLISSTYYNIMTSNVYATYNDISGTLIYKDLSASILLSGFELPNIYSDKIQNYKIRYNIDSKFDESLELDKIEDGISQLNNYSNIQQGLLSIEIDRRNDIKYKLESRSRYYYYNQLKVKEYFKFIENEYNNRLSNYMSCNAYDIDTTYIEISSVNTTFSLMNNDCTINDYMIRNVAKLLLDITKIVRHAREYLKSHAQRTYMKGTFLLIQYVINEYLKNNVYKTVQSIANLPHEIGYDTHDTEITLTEYIDQTQYYNIEADDDPLSADVNQKFWIDFGSNSNLNNLDNTNIFRAQDKSKLVTGKMFSIAQIADFYNNILNNKNLYSTDLEMQLSITENVRDFLNSVFEVGADSTYLDKNGNVMCAIQYGKYSHTQQIEDYIQHIADLTAKNMFILSDYQNEANLSLSGQLDAAETSFRQSLLDSYSNALVVQQNTLLKYNQDINDELQSVESIYEQFENLNLQYNNFVLANSPYTGPYIETTSNYLLDKIVNYTISVAYFNYTIPTMKPIIKKGIDSLYASLNSLFNNLKTNLQVTKIHTDYDLQISCYDDQTKNIWFDFNYLHLPVSDYINAKTKFDSIRYFEIMHQHAKDVLQSNYNSNSFNTVQQVGEIQSQINVHTQTEQYASYIKLKTQLSDYLDSSIGIFSIPAQLRQILDYSSTEHYKSKARLYYKYIGLDIGEHPYYNLTNQTHPSYQLHPCLQNFIEYVNYTYPLEQLVGIAKDNIEYIVKIQLDKMLDSEGYLSAVWRNPLNGNSDYLTKYEKTNHIDENNNECKTYGWDGLFYPEAVCDIQTSATYCKKWIQPLNLPQTDISKELYKLQHYTETITTLINDVSVDIYKYGLDIYGNSYILVKQYRDNNLTEQEKLHTPGVLWMKYKNYPFAYPAITYNKHTGGEFNSDTSQLDNILSASNAKFDDFSRVEIQNTKVSNSTFAPQFTDFTISKDRTSIMLAGTLSEHKVDNDNEANYKKSTLIFADVCQNYVKKLLQNSTNFYMTYERSFNQNFALRTNLKFNSECIPHPGERWDFNSFYTKNNYIGGIYTLRNSNKLDLAVKMYNYNNDQYMNPTISTDASNTIVLKMANSDFSIDCTAEGDITIAQLYKTTTHDISTYLNTSADYQVLSNYIDVFNDEAIWTQDMHVVENTMFKQQDRSYQPFVEMGFIPLLTGNNDIRNTNLTTDLQNDNILKFQLIGLSQDNLSGIDFKFTIPIRMYEGFSSSYATDVSYHRNSSDISCRIFDFANAHYAESLYNQYMTKTNTDAIFYDKDEIERINYLSVDPDDELIYTNYCDYVKLANHDVTRYFELMRSELSTDDEDYFIVKPYLICADSLDKIPPQYVNGYLPNSTEADVNQGNFFLRMFDDCAEISVSWTINDVNTIKLDFNSRYYTETYKNDQNLRNKHHLFLNLDKPGEAGYLNCFNGDMAGKNYAGTVQYTFFIKNISFDGIPKFIMSRVNKPEIDYVGKVIGAYEYDLFNGNIVKSSDSAAVLRLDGFENKYFMP